jgi:hypothetical protein
VERAACIVGGPDRVRIGGVELARAVLRRALGGLPTDSQIDFEKARA